MTTTTARHATLPADEVHLWTADPDAIGPRCLERHFHRLLSRDEQDRCLRYVFDADRRLYLTARALLRTVLSQYARIAPEAWRFATDEFGKPRLEPERDLRFSLTHTTGLAAVAVACGREVGVDAECLSRAVDWLPIAERFFAAEEAARLRALPASEQCRAFFQYWTLKEAFVKACGKGLSLPLDAFRFEFASGQPPRIHFTAALPHQAERWQFFLRSTADQLLAVALAGSSPGRLVDCGAPAGLGPG